VAWLTGQRLDGDAYAAAVSDCRNMQEPTEVSAANQAQVSHADGRAHTLLAYARIHSVCRPLPTAAVWM